MHPTQIISYYPNYALLDQIVSKGYKNLNLFIDLKNCAQSLYQKHCIDMLLENSYKSNYIDSSIFTSVLSFLSFHKLYAVKRKLNINVYIFFESGYSYYHTNLSKKYKVSRKIDDLYGLDHKQKEDFYSIVRNNYLLIEKVFNRVPHINVIRLENLEADFIPYYLIKNNMVNNINSANIIYSNDHDLKQTLLNKDCFIFSKAHKVKKIISKGEVMTAELKKECDIPDEYLPFYMSIIGDNGDDVEGINGIGPMTFVKIFDQLQATTGGMSNLYDNVFNENPIFNISSNQTSNLHLKKIIQAEETAKQISTNMKLVSFELLSRYLDNPRTTEMIQKKEQIINCLNTPKVLKEPIIKALEMNRIFLESDDMEVLFYESDKEGLINDNSKQSGGYI